MTKFLDCAGFTLIIITIKFLLDCNRVAFKQLAWYAAQNTKVPSLPYLYKSLHSLTVF